MDLSNENLSFFERFIKSSRQSPYSRENCIFTGSNKTLRKITIPKLAWMRV
jgi:hypothetical protein